jgi:hypothetical protein
MSIGGHQFRHKKAVHFITSADGRISGCIDRKASCDIVVPGLQNCEE